MEGLFNLAEFPSGTYLVELPARKARQEYIYVSKGRPIGTIQMVEYDAVADEATFSVNYNPEIYYTSLEDCKRELEWYDKIKASNITALAYQESFNA